MKTNVFILIAIISIFLLSLSTCTTDNNPSSYNSSKTKILFLSQRLYHSQDWQIYIMDIDGNNQKRICDSIVRCAYAIPSHNGSLIAFTTYTDHYYNLYVINSSGENVKFISNGKRYCGSPAWSPDDSKIIFLKNSDFNSDRTDIYIYDLSQNVEFQLTQNQSNCCPSWFPPGSQIAYTSCDSSGAHIYLMNSDGSNKMKITPDSISLCCKNISPDGNKLCAVSNNFEGSQIFIMDIDGRNLKQLTFTVSPIWMDHGFPRDANSNPVWSPNGKKIAYVSHEKGNADIFIMNSDGTNKKQLSADLKNDNQPCWSPNGRYIIFTSNRNLANTWEIFRMNADGTNQIALSNHSGYDSFPFFIK